MNIGKRLLSAGCCILLVTCSAFGQRAEYSIVPQPRSVEVDESQSFGLRSGMAISYDAANPEAARTAQLLQKWVEEQTGVALNLTPGNEKAEIRLVLDNKTPKKTKKGQPAPAISEQEQEAYTIAVNNAGIDIHACQPVGLFRAAQTLRKCLPIVDAKDRAGVCVNMPYVRIQDEPRFAYRGVLLDCARHFFTVDVVKKFLDVMALHGCNQFHWHLSDDQGWRFEVKALPELAEKGSVREQTVIGPGASTGIYDGMRYGGYYTQEECRDIISYAAERYINIVPEIDLPGHMQSALHVFPNLGCTGGPYPVKTYWGVSREVLCGGNPQTLTFLKTVLGEICDVFPSKFIHIGGDECPKDRWRKCDKCQAKIRELGIKDDGKHSPENQLQTYINHEMELFLAERGRAMVGWDEIMEGGLTQDAVVMSWRGIKGGIGAARQHHRVIMSPNVYTYIDHPQLKDYGKQPRTTDSYSVSACKIYSFEPVVPDSLTAEEQKYIIGVQANLWTEHVAYPEHAFYQLLPRLGAMSEVQWCRPEQKDFENLKARLPRLQKLYELLKVPYCHQVE